MTELTIIYRRIDELKPTPGNPRTHSKKQLQQIARSIKEFGFVNPVLVDDRDRIVAGHGRVEAAKMRKMDVVPTVNLEHLTETQVKAYLIADNKLAENAGWDSGLLKLEIQDLMGCDYDVTLTGLEMAEIDLLLAEPPAAEDKPAVVDRSEPAVSRSGDLWRIGEHLVLCGDSTEEASYQALLGNETAGMVFSDPPWNVPVSGHVSVKGGRPEFAMASGEMTEAAFTAFLKTIFQHLTTYSRDGSLHYICMDWRHIMEVLVAAKDTYSEQKNLCVWTKTNSGMGNLYRSQHELVFVFKNGTASHINNVELGKHGRNRSNVWSYAGANAFGESRDDDLAMHPTTKPVELVAEAIMDVSNRGDIVLDAFGGSGSTLVAAEQTGRRGRAIEIDPYYVDTIVKRLEAATKKNAVLVKTGESFEAVKAWRRSGIE